MLGWQLGWIISRGPFHLKWFWDSSGGQVYSNEVQKTAIQILFENHSESQRVMDFVDV